MIYLYVGKNTVKLLALSKSLLGQYSLAHFSKVHSNELLLDGRISSTDLVASAIKEALTGSQPQPVSDKEVTLILPQEAFIFGRYKIPSDMSESAIEPFVKDKVRSDLHFDVDQDNYDYLVRNMESDSEIFFYGQKKEIIDEYTEVFQLLQLNIKRIIPETLTYYTLFEKTLRKDKHENILYAAYKEENSFGYMYDTLGLVEDKKMQLTKDIKKELKKVVDGFNTANDGKINRLILSGELSTKVRQDLFTKDVGAWTNPLEKIIENFYKDYLKMLVPNEESHFPVLEFDVCFGAFIFNQTNNDFTLMKQGSNGSRIKFGKGKMNNGSSSGPKLGSFGEVFNLKTLMIFVASFVISFVLIFGFMRLSSGGFNFSLPSTQEEPEEVEPTTAPEPTATPEPTPSITREELQVSILNGSGTPGLAGEVEDILQEAGYTDLVAGNADSFDYETTEIQIKEEFADALGFLQEDLEDNVTIEDTETLDEDDSADVIIIIGQDFEL